MQPTFKDYYFATFRIPRIISVDFSIWSKLPSGDLGVHIHIPGEERYISFCSSAVINLKNLNRGYSTIYSLDSAASFTPLVPEYFTSDRVLFDALIKGENPSHIERLLVKAKISEMSPTDFIELVRIEFLKKMKSTFTSKFKVKELNPYTEGKDTIETILSPMFLEKVSATFNRSFNKMGRYLNPKINQKYSHVLKLNEINSVIDSCGKIKLLSDLQNDLLVNSNLYKKSVKI